MCKRVEINLVLKYLLVKISHRWNSRSWNICTPSYLDLRTITTCPFLDLAWCIVSKLILSLLNTLSHGIGILLYEMLYGRTPFRGKNRKKTFYNILHKDLTFPSSIPVRNFLLLFLFYLHLHVNLVTFTNVRLHLKSVELILEPSCGSVVSSLVQHLAGRSSPHGWVFDFKNTQWEFCEKSVP